MQIVFQDKTSIPIIASVNPVMDCVYDIFKHLQHVDIPFKAWDSHLYRSTSLQVLAESLVEYASKLGIRADLDKCCVQDQTYFNALHRLYEFGYDGDQRWLDFHEHIHLCEQFGRPTSNLFVSKIDYREKAGLLEKKYDPAWLAHGTTTVGPGDVYTAWHELGKKPYQYWLDRESDEIEHVCKLVKPWTKFRPILFVAFHHIDFLKNISVDKFTDWWSRYQDQWCKHHNIACWSVKDMATVNVVGKISNLALMRSLLARKIYPVRVRLT